MKGILERSPLPGDSNGSNLPIKSLPSVTLLPQSTADIVRRILESREESCGIEVRRIMGRALSQTQGGERPTLSAHEGHIGEVTFARRFKWIKSTDQIVAFGDASTTKHSGHYAVDFRFT
jgi:hypothetical protein